MQRRTPYFSLERVAKACAGDDVEEMLITNIQHQFQEMWPSTLRPPDALNDLFIAVATLIDWNSRSPKGKNIMRKRILQLIAALNQEAEWGPNDLATNAHALQVVPGLLQALQREGAPLEPDVADQLVDELDRWLATGDD